MPTDSNLIFRTTDDSRWTGKGANLTPSEVDENFYDLDSRLQAVEDNPALPQEIQSVSVTGNQMTITLSDGVTVFGPFTLPQAAFRFRGSYDDIAALSDNSIATYDFFVADDGLYMALQNQDSLASEFDADDADVAGPFYQFILPFPNLYDVGFFFPGSPGLGIDDGEAMFTFRANRDFYLLATLPGTTAGLQAATTADLSLPIYKNTTAIGSMAVAAGQTVATFTFAADVQFASGDRLRVLRPTALDDTAKDFSVNFAARKGVLS